MEMSYWVSMHCATSCTTVDSCQCRHTMESPMSPGQEAEKAVERQVESTHAWNFNPYLLVVIRIKWGYCVEFIHAWKYNFKWEYINTVTTTSGYFVCANCMESLHKSKDIPSSCWELNNQFRVTGIIDNINHLPDSGIKEALLTPITVLARWRLYLASQEMHICT